MVVAELGGAEREAGVGSRRGHVRVRRRRRRREGGLELVGVGRVAGLVMRVDGRGGEEPVRVGRRVPGVLRVGADAQGHLVNYGAALGMGKAVARLEERGRRRARGQDGVGVGVVGGGGEGRSGRVGQQGVRGQALGVCVWASRAVRGAAVRQVGERVRVNGGGDVGVRPQRAIVAVPLFAAVV